MKKRNVIFLLWLFCGVFYTVSAFTIEAGDDQTVFIGATTVLGGSPTASGGKEPYSYKWFQGNSSVSFSTEANPMITVLSGTNNYTLEVVDGNGISCSGEVVVVVGESNPNSILLNWVQFNNSQPVVKDDVLQNTQFNTITNDNLYSNTYNLDKTPKSSFYTPISNPGWSRMTNTSDPVCYVSGETISVTITLEYNIVSGSSTIEIIGIADGGYEFSTTTTLDGSGMKTITINANTALPLNEVNIFEPFRIKWNISFDGQSYVVMGQSANYMYVVYDIPNSSVSSNGGFETPLFETLLSFSCRNAKGAIDKINVINGVWNGFSTLSVFNFEGQYLSYYKNYNILNLSTQLLLKNKDGQCSAWAVFFIDALKVQGIHNVNNYIYMNHNKSYYQNERWFFIKDWAFNQNGTPHQPIDNNPNVVYSHENWVVSGGDKAPANNNSITDVLPVLVPVNKLQNEFYFFKEEVKDLEGVEGQFNNNPNSIFKNHQLVFLAETGMYYDPSYFLTYISPNDFDNKSITAYSYIDEKTVDEYQVQNGVHIGVADYNNDGDMNDLNIGIARMHIRENQLNTNDISISTGGPVPNTY